MYRRLVSFLILVTFLFPVLVFAQEAGSDPQVDEVRESPLHGIVSLQSELLLDPERNDIRVRLIRELLKAAMFEKALGQLALLPASVLESDLPDRESLIVNLRSFSAYEEAVQLARLRFAAGDTKQAENALKTVDGIFPNCPLTRSLAIHLRQLSPPVEAVDLGEFLSSCESWDYRRAASLAAALDAAPSLGSRMESWIGRGYLSLKDYKSASRHLERALELDASNDTAWTLYGVSLVYQGFVEKAGTALERALALQPEDIPSRVRRHGVAYLATGVFKTERAGFTCGLNLSWLLEKPEEIPVVAQATKEEPGKEQSEEKKRKQPRGEKHKQPKKAPAGESTKDEPESRPESGSHLKRIALIAGAAGGGAAAIIAASGGSDPDTNPDPINGCASWSGDWNGTLTSSPRCGSGIGGGTFPSFLNLVDRGNSVRIEIDRLPPLDGVSCSRPLLEVPKFSTAATYETSWVCSDPHGNVYRFRWTGNLSCSPTGLSWTSVLSSDKNQNQYCTWDLRGSYNK